MRPVNLIAAFLCFISGGLIGYYYALSPGFSSIAEIISPIGLSDSGRKRPLDIYTIEALAAREYPPGNLEFGEIIATGSAVIARKFRYPSDGKWVAGLAHLPRNKSLTDFPVIIQARGYVPREEFSTGIGTKRSAEVFAANGFISLAPDFLGYGNSEDPSDDVFEERFQTYTALLNLYFSVKTGGIGNGKVGFWGHSNGGQIVLTAIEVLEMKRQAGTAIPIVPVTLWAPVTKRFPYSILYYTDEADDGGKALRKKLADFEALYDADKFALTAYLSYLRDPLQVHQGTSDDAVPVRWTREFTDRLKDDRNDFDYFEYPGADHNMLGAWNTVVERDIRFFGKYLKK